MQASYKKFILLISEGNYAEANKVIETIAEQKIAKRIQQQVNEGIFDRLGARAAGLGAGIKARVQNLGTRVGSAAKAVGQNVVGAATGKGFGQGQATVDAANKDIAGNDPRKRAKAAQADNLIASFGKDLSILYPGLNVAKLLKSLRTQLNFAAAAAPAPAAASTSTPVATAAPAAAAPAPAPKTPAPTGAVPAAAKSAPKPVRKSAPLSSRVKP